MAQDGHHAGHQGSAASDGNGTPPSSEIVTNPPSPRESNNNQGTLTPVDLALPADAVDEKDVVPSVDGEEEGAGLATGEVAAGTDVVVAEDDATKGKGKVIAVDAGAGGDEAPPHFMMERERRKRMKDKFTDLSALLPNATEKTDKATMVAEAIDHIRHLEDTLRKLQKRKRERLLAKAMRAAAGDLGASSSSAPPPYAGQGTGQPPVLPPQGWAGSSSAPPQHAGQQGAGLSPVLPQGCWAGSSSAPPPHAGKQVPVLSPVLPQGWGWMPKKKAGAARPIGFQTWSESDIVLNVAGDDAFVTVCTAQRPGVLLLVLSVLEKHHIDVISAQISSDVNRTMFTLYTRMNLEAINQLDPEAPSSEDIYQLAVSEIIVWLSG